MTAPVLSRTERQARRLVTSNLRGCGYTGTGFDGITGASFDEQAEQAFLRAEADCRGELTNDDGRRRSIDPRSLFTGTDAHARRWASEELIEWWELHGRPTRDEYRQDLIRSAVVELDAAGELDEDEDTMTVTTVAPAGAGSDAGRPRSARPTAEQQLLSEVEAVYRKFMWMPTEHAYTVATLWVAHTHLRSNEGEFLPRTTPRLYFGSKRAGCGKTMAMELTTLMSHNGKIMTEPTQPGLVSAINNNLATIGLDEIDLYFGVRGTAKTGVRAILNTGYKKGATVDRERNDEVEERNVHGPACTAGKNANRFMTAETFETLRTRSIAILLERKPVGTPLAKYREDRHEPVLRALGARLRRWGSHTGKRVVRIDTEPLIPGGIDNRDEEIWAPLFQVAAHVGGDWPGRLAKAAKALVLGDWEDDDSPVLSPAQELLEAARGAFLPDEDFLPTSVLLSRLLRVDAWWRDDWTSPHAAKMELAATLGTFGIEHSRAYVDGRQCRGYALVDLLDEPVEDDWDDEPATAVEEWDWSGIDDD